MRPILFVLVLTLAHPAFQQGCNPDSQFECTNGHCIPINWTCDRNDDCGDMSDESEDLCGPQLCDPGEFLCENGNCIPERWICDGDNDCGDLSDERNCPCPNPSHVKCDDEFTCIPPEYICDGIRDCPDNSDETNCTSLARPQGSLLRRVVEHKLPGKGKLYIKH
ncbi:low-density lipoprotein receptor-related protein 8 [Folsomia candida]|uniref:Low-density lipoprotein receptor-related protein 2 n=1 Tax=Folsomia candida TaxID=158441 RepID=A0A226E7Y3_FOLCA|nr:low-density lipoprotein receptor-related protein 8 [Folsomia candida]OXA52981.1 Low-density lipoprotein receptor-related protein 2 [Folsomia candida]